MRTFTWVLVANILMAPVLLAGSNLRWTPVDGTFPSKALGLASPSSGLSIRDHLGVPAECKLIAGPTYAAAYSKTKRYFLECRDYPIWGSEVIAMRDINNQLSAVNATLPSNRDVFNIPVLAEYLKTPPLQLANVGQKELETGFLIQEGELVPAFKRTSARGPTKVSFVQYISAITGAAIRTVPQALAAEALVFEFNHLGDKRVWTNIENTGTKLDASSYRVLPDLGARTYSEGGKFEDATNSSAFRQTQVFYAIQKMVNYWKQLGVTSQGQIDVMVDSAYGGQTNNALYLPATSTLDPEIHIGPGGGEDHSYALDNDIAQHEFNHHVLDPFIGSGHIESLLLHEALADFFTAHLNDHPEFAPSIRKDGRPLRTMMLAGGHSIDDPDIEWGIHELSQFLSSALWGMRRYIDDIDELVWEAVTLTGRSTPISDFFWALEQADRNRNGSIAARDDQHPENDNQTSASSCEIFESAIDFGFTRFLAQHENTPCGLSIAALTEESIERKPDLFLHLEGLYASSLGVNSDESGSGCGVIGASRNTNKKPNKIPTAILFLPFILLIRISNYDSYRKKPGLC